MPRISIAWATPSAALAAFCCAVVTCLLPAPATAQFVCGSATPGGADGATATGFATVVCGTNAGANAISDNGRNTAFGYFAGAGVSGEGNSALGTGAGSDAVGDRNTAIGWGAGQVVRGSGNSAFGTAAGEYLTGDNNVAIGNSAGSGEFGSQLVVSNTVAIGNSTTARADGGVAIGYRSQTNGTNSVAVGASNTVNGDNSSVLGNNNNINNAATPTAGWGDNVNVVGSRNIVANTASASGSTVLGNGNAVDASNAFVIGNGATVTGGNAVAIGNGVHVAGVNGIAVGKFASADYANSAAFGAGATATRDNQQVFGTTNNTYTMSGIASSASRAAQSGPVRVVTSDAGGNLATASLADLGVASIGDINAINTRLNDLTKESRRGIAAAAALATAMTPSAPGKTTVSLNSGFFKGETGVGAAVAHRLNFSTPVIVHGSYANSGGNGHVGRVGIGFEF